MDSLQEVLQSFIIQSLSGDLKTSGYPKEWDLLNMKTSFGMGAPARIPWIAFTTSEMTVSNGFYPVYLYYKDFNTLILAYGVSETQEYADNWPVEIMNNSVTIKSFFDKDVKRYGDSFVFKAYKVKISEKNIKLTDYSGDRVISSEDLESDLNTILTYYKNVFHQSPLSVSVNTIASSGLFYMEKQLEDFIIHNWENTKLAETLDLVYEEGELVSQQYKTDIGPIDILAKEKNNGSYVVIELKKNQTSDDTVGQIARYMGWIKSQKGDKNVKGIIIAGEYDKKLDFALNIVGNIDVYLYKVDFTLNEFRRDSK